MGNAHLAPPRLSPVSSAVLLAAFLAGAAEAPPATSPSIVSVNTSRGACDLKVYAPRGEIEDPLGPRPADPRRSDPKPLVLLVSGEGGWRRFDEVLAGLLADAGFWVGGVDAMQYFWHPQDDRQALAADCRTLAGALAAAAKRPADAPLVLAGYSFGADIAPWVAGAGGWGDRVRGLVMIGPDETGSLEFRVSEILGFQAKDHVFSVAEALRGVAGTPVLFLHGAKDKDSAARVLSTGAVPPKKLIVIPGADHHFSGREEDLEAALRDGMAWLLRGGAGTPAPMPARP